MWLKHEGFLYMIKNLWQNYVSNGNPNFVLVQKLRNLKDISNWITEVFGKLDVKRNKALEELSTKDQAAENRPLYQPEKQKAVSLK